MTKDILFVLFIFQTLNRFHPKGIILNFFLQMIKIESDQKFNLMRPPSVFFLQEKHQKCIKKFKLDT